MRHFYGSSVYLVLKATFYSLLVLHQVFQIIMVNIIKEKFRVLADFIKSLDPRKRLIKFIRIISLIYF